MTDRANVADHLQAMREAHREMVVAFNGQQPLPPFWMLDFMAAAMAAIEELTEQVRELRERGE